MPEDVHHKFAVVAVGDAQLIRAVGKVRVLLLRVPLLGGNPACALGCEMERGYFVSYARKDSVGAGVMTVEFGVRDVDGRLVEKLESFDSVD